MQRLLLDIILPGERRHPRIPIGRDTLNHVPVKEPADTVVSQNPADTVVSNLPVDSVPAADTDTLSQAQNLLTAGNGDDGSMLIWAICIVAVVLLLCLYLARAYRLRLQTN